MIQRYSDVAENNLTSLSYRKGRKSYLTLKIWLGDKTAKNMRQFFVLCPHCNSGRVRVFGWKKVNKDFTSEEKTDKMFLECQKCEKRFLPDDLIIGKEIRRSVYTANKYQLFIKSHNGRDFESEIISAFTRYEAAKIFHKKYFIKGGIWTVDELVEHIVDMTSFIETGSEKE